MSLTMKYSGIDWLGEVPCDWNLFKGKYIFALRTTKGNSINQQLLSPTQKYGVIPQELYEELSGMNAVKLSETTDYSTLKTVHVGDYCISLRSFQGGFEYSNYEGVVSPAYQIFYPVREVDRRYYKYLFKDDRFITEMNSFTMSLRDGKPISFSDFGNSIIPYPSLAEQHRIADYLDEKCASIDAAIEAGEKEIEKLKAYKQSVIINTVTKGLNPNVEMKDSSVKWIGKVPAKWNVMRQKYCMSMINGRAFSDSEFEEDGKYRVLRVGNLYSNPIWYTSSLELPANKYCNTGDLLYSWSMSYGPIVWSGEKTIYHYHIWKVELNNNIYKEFAYFYLQALTEAIKSDLHETTMSFLTMNTMNNAFIALPPSIQEQKQIADYLKDICSEIDILIDRRKKVVYKLEEYKKSLIYNYVTGKREVPNG